ncbi:MAG: Ig-like domain-containing protein [Ruminococcus sp.]|nr:Ig-like domain-containing protein [Ruminococcus sp.]
MKKLLSILLSALICFSSLTGLTVFAEETEPATKPDTQPTTTEQTTTEQVTTTTTPKSTIPGGAYVTYNLTNVTSSNMQEEVWGYYETTFSPEPGYKINYISVKQGDKDMPVIDNGDGTYTFKNEGGFTDNLTITVKAKPFPTKLSVTDMSLYVSTSDVIDVIDGTAIEWKSSNEQVATVKDGKVLGVGVGTAKITVTLSTYDHLTCNVKVLDYARQPLPSTTQKFCDAVNQYIIDCGFEEMYFVETDENGNKVMLTPDNIKSNSGIKIYLETTNFAIFNISGVLTACSEETIEGYTFNYNTTFTNDNPCGYCVYKNNKIYSIKDAVDKGITDIRTLAYVIPGTTKDGVPVTVNKNEYAKVDCPINFSSNKSAGCKIGNRYTTTIKMEPYNGQEFIIYDVFVIMNKDTFVTPIRVNENTVVVDIPYVTGDIEIKINAESKTYPTVGETMGCFATNMENVSYYLCGWNSDEGYLLEDQIFSCAVYPLRYKIVPDEGYEIVSLTVKERILDRDTGEYTIHTYSPEKTDKNEYFVSFSVDELIFEGEVRKIPAEISASQLSLKYGEIQTLKVTDGTAKSWTTSNKNVATVNNGKVTAVGKGTATITATLTTGEKLTCKVTVVNSPKLTLSNVILKSGGAKTIKAVGGTVKSWTTSNKNVATVKDGKITALNRGTATVTATLTTGKKLTCKVVVSTAPRLTKTTVKVKKGGTATVVISGKASTIDNKYTNTKIAKINSKVSTSVLKIKGLKKGTTTLKIKVNGVKTLNLKVNVK